MDRLRTAVVSDAHANAVAVRAVLADLEERPVDQVVCLGDMVQGGAEPGDVVEMLREHAWPTVMGNADAFLLDATTADGAETITERQLEIRDWSLAQLSDAQQAYIASFTPTVHVDLADGHTLLACHGSPTSYHAFVLPAAPEPEFLALVGSTDASVVAGGHTHQQFVRRLPGGLFLNPGSVGLSYDHTRPEGALRADPWAAYAVITTGGGRLSVELVRVPVDAAEIADVTLASGMPYAVELAARWSWAMSR
jgi:predicted phosphodiesterase